MDVGADIVGLEQARLKLLEAEQRTSLRVIRGALRFGLKPTITMAKQLVAVDTSEDADDYSLRDSIGVRAERKKNRAGNATTMRFGAHRETADPGDTSGYAIKGGLSKNTKAPNYAGLVEKDKPFLLPSIERTSSLVVRRFGDRFVQSVNKL